MTVMDGGGPSEQPFERVHLPIPPDFTGPICADCKSVRGSERGDRYAFGVHLSRCLAHAYRVTQPARRCTITGEIYQEQIEYPLCRDHNDLGQCERFEPKHGVGLVALEESARAEAGSGDPYRSLVPSRGGDVGPGELRGGGPGPLKLLAGSIGRWLVIWGSS
jgi:hypothetical protein